MADNWQHLARVADDLCFFRGCQVDSVNHPTAMYQMNCGNRFGGDPAIGAWVTYGLGSENSNLPGYVVLPEVSDPQGGAPGEMDIFRRFIRNTLAADWLTDFEFVTAPWWPRVGSGRIDLLKAMNERHAARTHSMTNLLQGSRV